MFHRMSNYGETEIKPFIVLTKELIRQSLPKYKRHEDLIIVQHQAWEDFKKSLPIPVTRKDDSPFTIDEDELASLVCQSTQKPHARRLAVETKVNNDDYRSPNVSLVLGDNGIVCRKENHIIYRFDITKCMFSFGNINEKMRLAEMDCSEEIIVDLFAGIGYFTLPLLVHAKAKHLYACEWNPDAIDALKKNLTLNKVDASKCTIIEGDNRISRPTDVAQRVVLGILPSCLDWMQTAFECVDKSTGAILHCHDLVDLKEAYTRYEQHRKQRDAQNDPQTSSSTSNSFETASNGERLALNATDSTTNSSISFLNLPLSSSSSSHSTIEKIPSSYDEFIKQQQTNDSDKERSSPALLEESNDFGTSDDSSSNSRVNKTPGDNIDSIDGANSMTMSSCPLTSTIIPPEKQSISSSANDSNSYNQDQMKYNQYHQVILEERAHELIARIREDVEAHDLTVSLVHIQPVKSYAPHVGHFVFDIKIEPKLNNLSKFPCCESYQLEDFHPDYGHSSDT